MSRFHRRRVNGTPIDPLTRLWLLRIIVTLGGHREFLRAGGFGSDALAEALGLGHWIEPDDQAFSSKAVLAELQQLHQKAERDAHKTPMPALLEKNIERLADLVGLSATDCQILVFIIVIWSERLLDDTADYLGDLSSLKAIHALAVILDIPEDDVRRAFRAEAVLSRSGLVQMNRTGACLLGGKFNLLSLGFADRLITSDADPVSLLQGTINLAQPGHLELSDYGHIEDSLSILRPYLRHAAESGQRGVNVLLYGPPGTGKSQLARSLAKELGCELFEVASEDEDGDPINGEHRLRAFRAGQCFFAQRRALIAFDEIEDVFNDGTGFFGGRSTAQKHKAWLNRALEENPVPTVWLSNAIQDMDPAFVRRFDMVFELPVPPKAQRQRIVRQACGDLVDEACIQRLAEVETMAPAVVDRAASVVRAIGSRLDDEQRGKALEHLIGNTLEAQGHDGLRRHDPNRLPELYDPAFIHADTNLSEVAEGLKRARTGRLCLYGPPGTGKTAYGRWLAEQLDAPLLVKRASDLLSRWLGGSEKNLARAFREAERENAVLLIDEVDSFLQDRRGARKSWEVSGVNEMLTQMESFAGVFIASTNLMSGLDQAALRRFDLKVKFDFLEPLQSLELLRRHCRSLGLEEPDSASQQDVLRLKNLTPGDFAAVMRQHRFRPITSAVRLVEVLRAECSLKERASTMIGFVTASSS